MDSIDKNGGFLDEMRNDSNLGASVPTLIDLDDSDLLFFEHHFLNKIEDYVPVSDFLINQNETDQIIQ